MLSLASALTAAEDLKGRGVNVRVLNMHTIKPLDETAILLSASETRRIVTAEEHRVTGGLGGAVAELLSQRLPTPMRLIGMPDKFAIVGPTDKVREHYHMDTDGLLQACLDLME